jgi:rSAM/selenodomain-associated transferase 1
MKPVHVAVMARQPTPGHAKTRLIPALGAHGAAQVAQQLLEHALAQAQRAALGPITLCVTPDDAQVAPALREIVSRAGAAIAGQGDGDLGARMARALDHGLCLAPAALVIGTDAPALDAAVLRAAATALDTHDSVLVPAFDGGFVLLGVRRPCPTGLFDGLAWSHAQVLHDTLARLRAHGFAPALLAPLHDIDTPDDLQHLPSGWRASHDSPQ